MRCSAKFNDMSTIAILIKRYVSRQTDCGRNYVSWQTNTKATEVAPMGRIRSPSAKPCVTTQVIGSDYSYIPADNDG
jgi:hypothetical protein